jgi:formylglycine-generating enzyme required for sulfatase activity
MISSRTWFSVTLLVILPAAIVGFLFAQQAPAGKKVAFLVGVNKYKKPGFDTLHYAERDVRDLKVELDKLGFRTALLTGDEATRKNIEQRLKEQLEGLGQEDTILVVLNGHGIQFKAPGRTKEDAYFCPVDAVKNDPEKLVSLSYLIDELLAPHVGKKLVMVDACRDAPSDPTRSVKGVQGRTMTLPENTAVLFSCQAGQQSIENEKAGGGHGVFTYCLLDALHRSAAPNGELTWTRLVTHVEDLMEQDKQVLEWIGTDRRQLPIATGNVGRTLLGIVAATETTADRSRPNQRETRRMENRTTAIPNKIITNSIGMKLAYIKPATFMMGSPAEERDRGNDEDQHEVEITQPYYIGVFPVTQQQYQRVMNSNPSYFTREKGGDADYPVERVSWTDAVEFCKKLSELPEEREGGRVYRLPTEAEWEYACRAGTRTAFHFGSSLSSRQANFDGSSVYGGAERGPNLEKTSAVGSYKPNDFGLYDMHGNVWQWCADWYDAKYYKSGPRQDPRGPTSGRSRVMRGGCWQCDGAWLRAANRGKSAPGRRDDGFGFRIALSASSGNR